MAELILSKGRDGRRAWKVKIYLGKIAGKRKFLIKTIHGKKSDALAWARERETARDTGKLIIGG